MVFCLKQRLNLLPRFEIVAWKIRVAYDVESPDKLAVVLDLDETLVCAYEASSLPDPLRNQAIEASLKWFELECISWDKECEGKSKINYVTVFERPGSHEFSSQFADQLLVTAVLEGYARPLVDRIDTENIFSCRLYRPATVGTHYGDHVKDLTCLSKNMCRGVNGALCRDKDDSDCV